MPMPDERAFKEADRMSSSIPILVTLDMSTIGHLYVEAYESLVQFELAFGRDCVGYGIAERAFTQIDKAFRASGGGTDFPLPNLALIREQVQRQR